MKKIHDMTGMSEACYLSTSHTLCVCSAGDLELDCHPFPHCIIRNFLSNESFVENLQRELLQLNFHEKSNDLYKFKQVSIKLTF